MTDTMLPAMRMVTTAGELIGVATADDLLAVAGLSDLRAAEMGSLAQFVDDARELKSIADEATDTVSREVIRRLDRAGRWTTYVGGFKVTAPSPEAGTVVYDTDQLREALELLVDEDLIDAAGAAAAVEEVPGSVIVTRAQLDGILDALGRDPLVAGTLLEDLRDAVPPSMYKQKPAGIKALLKLGGDAKAAIEACRVDAPTPDRKAKVVREHV